MILLVLLVLASYSTSFPGAYLYDDYPIVKENPLVIEPHLPTILAADYWGWGVNSKTHRPLTILSYVANRALFGTEAFSFHLVNVLLHTGVTLLLYGTLLALGRGMVVSWPAAALFAVHPIHTEAVNIITGRSELLAAAFMFLGLLLAYRRSRFHHLWVGVSYAAALLSKENAVTFPLLLFLGDAFVERDLRGLLRRRWPLYAQSAALTMAWLAMRRWALPFAGLPHNTTIRSLDNPLVDLSLLWHVATVIKVQLLYLGTLLLPVRLHAAYTDRMIGAVTSVGDPWLAAVVLVLVGYIGLLVFGWWRREAYALGLAWYGAAFIVMSNLFYITGYLMGERFVYTPSAGFCLAAAGLTAAALGKIADPGRRRWVFVAVVASSLLLLTGRTALRNVDFQDHIGFWEAETRSAPDNIRAWLCLSGAYQQEERWEDAEKALTAAERLDPGLPETWISLGALYQRLGRAADARDAFRRALDTGFVNRDSLSGYVDASLRLGFPRDALAVLEWLASLFREEGWYWHLVGRARNAAGDQKGGNLDKGFSKQTNGPAEGSGAGLLEERKMGERGMLRR